jgi:predicted DNA binding CopG/RHH family protein
MRKQEKTLPHFETEQDELAFWDENDPADWIEGPADIIVRLKRPVRKKTVTMRLDEPLYDELRAVAAEHGLPYQRLMRELLRQSLRALKRPTP